MARRLVFAAAMCTWLCCGTTAVGQGGGTGGTGGRGGGRGGGGSTSLDRQKSAADYYRGKAPPPPAMNLTPHGGAVP